MIQFNSKLTTIAFALSISFSASADHHGEMQGGDMNHQGEQKGEKQGEGMQGSMMGTHCPLKLNANQFELRVLPEDVKNDLLFMREEEKLARDVYQALYIKWFSNIHGNIADSEQKHMDRIKVLLDAYGLDDSASEDEGTFNNETLQTLYDELVAQGLESELEAYKVGAYIEEVDIKDLEDAIERTDIPELKKMYTQLKQSSYMHLGKFHGKIIALGGEYAAQVLTQDAFDTILEAKSGMMVMGNGVRVPAGEEMGTNACFVSSLMVDNQAVQTGSSIKDDQAINISYQVDVDPSDVGKMADWIVVASHMSSEGGPANWFIRDGEQWQAWNGQLEGSSAAMSSDELQAMQMLPVFDGMLSGMLGKYTIYAGYRLEDNGLVFNPTPLKFTVKQ